MFGRKTTIAFLVAYVIVLGCVLWPGEGPAKTATSTDDSSSVHLAPLTGLPYCGCSMQLQDVRGMDGYKKACDEIAERKGDTVMFVPSASMENGKVNRIYIDTRHSPSEDQLKDLIGHARSKGLRVILMPIVLIDAPVENEWRGTISPESWDDWWDSYRDMIMHYARIAEDSGVSVLVVGSELVSTEHFVSEWRDTIKQIRGTFHGQLTYSSNWDHYAMVQFWDQLDIVGMNSYWKLGPDNDRTVPVDEVKRRWAAIQADLFTWQKSVNKPILLLEAGWCSLGNASYEPWDYTKVTEPLDLDLQKRLYEGFFESWWGKPESAGFVMWEWTPAAPGGPEDRGYTPRGKPAEDVMKDYFAKERWKVGN
jgi:hypothetical protein